MSSVLDSMKLPLAGLLPEKVLSMKSNKIEYKVWYEKIINYLGCCGLGDVVLLGNGNSMGDLSDSKEKTSSKSKGNNTSNSSNSKNTADPVVTAQRSWLVYSIIMARLDDQLVIQFSTIEKGNALELLRAIRNRFSAVNFFSKLQARREFNHISLSKGETISSYGARIKYVAKELELMDTAVSIGEMELISRLVDGLPKEYDNLILGLVRGIETITFDEFITILESKLSMSKMKGGDGETSGGATAALASFKGDCFKCGKAGHKSVDCVVPKGDSNKKDQEGNGGPGRIEF
jgi:hypothetical protein